MPAMLLRRVPCREAPLLCAALLLAAGLLPAPAAAWITSIRLTPAHPTERDSLRMVVSGELSNTCWAFKRGACDSLVGNHQWLSAFVISTEDYVCSPVLVRYSLTCVREPLAAGTYHITATEYHDLPPSPPYVFEFEFEVTPATSVASATWGKVRSLYR